MHERDFADRAFRAALRYELEEIVLVRMGREPVQHDDFGAALSLDAEDFYARLFLDEPATERVLCLVADDEYGVFRVLDRRLKVMKYAAGFAHSARRDDDRRPMGCGDRLRFFNGFHVVKFREFERRLVPPEQRARLRIVTFRMELEDVGDLHREWRVDVNG